jgi:hypothetical protein
VSNQAINFAVIERIPQLPQKVLKESSPLFIGERLEELEVQVGSGTVGKGIFEILKGLVLGII